MHNMLYKMFCGLAAVLIFVYVFEFIKFLMMLNVVYFPKSAVG